MNLRSKTIQLVFGLLLTSTLGGAMRPNILFISIDDLRPELGCYGQSHIISPHIDQLAARGTLFSRAYCQQAICGATRTSVLTGLRPDTTGVHGNGPHFRLKVPDAITLPQYFKQHGYHTQGFGKVFHRSYEESNARRSLDDPPSWSMPSWQPGPRFYYTPRGVEIAREVYGRNTGKKGADLDGWTHAFVRALSTEAPDVPDSTLFDGQITDRAIETLRELKGGRTGENPPTAQPFFLAVGYVKPHVPYVAPKKYWDLYDPAKIELAPRIVPPKDSPPIAMWNWGDLRTYSDMPKEGPVTPEQAQQLRHGYYACISFVDAQIGRLLQELDRLRLRDNTIVILWGDHGFHLGDYGIWCKNTNFEYSTRAPLIVSVPGAAAGKSAALVEFVDIYPSLCELAGLPAPSFLEGTSFVPLMKEPAKPWKTAAFSQFLRKTPEAKGGVMGYTMRTDQFRVTVWHPTDKPNDVQAVELYDHRADPGETVNVSGRPENAALVKQLTLQLRRGWREVRSAL